MSWMSYTFRPHLTAIDDCLDCGGDSSITYALVDAGQIPEFVEKVGAWMADSPRELLFERSFARSALHLSPMLIQLLAPSEQRHRQLEALDDACRHLPVLSVINAPMSLEHLIEHLRSLMLIEADDSPYLLRFADSQSFSAVNAAFTPEQRATFFSSVRHWWSVDHAGVLHDHTCNLAAPRSTSAVAPLPLRFEGAAVDALLSAAAGPILASQLRHLDDTFGRALSHAEQVTFATDCLGLIEECDVDSDIDSTSFALRRWRERIDGKRAAI